MRPATELSDVLVGTPGSAGAGVDVLVRRTGDEAEPTACMPPAALCGRRPRRPAARGSSFTPHVDTDGMADALLSRLVRGLRKKKRDVRYRLKARCTS
jgi:hypothetical protein